MTADYCGLGRARDTEGVRRDAAGRPIVQGEKVEKSVLFPTEVDDVFGERHRNRWKHVRREKVADDIVPLPYLRVIGFNFREHKKYTRLDGYLLSRNILERVDLLSVLRKNAFFYL